MNKTLIALVAAIAVVVGTTGVVRAAAQNSEPGDLLYPVRTWIEQRQNRTETQDDEQLQLQQTQEPAAAGDMLREQDQLQIREQDRIHQDGTATPQHINSQNPRTTNTPSPGSSYGPGTCSNCDEAHQQRQNCQEKDHDKQNGGNPGNDNKP